MRSLAALGLVLALADLAAAQPTQRKRSGGDALQMQAVEDFVEAVIADRAGDWDKAVREYQSANRKSPHANTYYNIADLFRRMEQYDRAIESYKKYLELAPQAADRAAVEKLIAELQRLPGRVYISGEDLGGIIFFDGKRLGPSPQQITVADARRHQIDRISPTDYEHRVVVVRPMDISHQRLFRGDDEPGNVVISHAPELPLYSVDLGTGARLRVPVRTQLKPGRHRAKPDGACNAVDFDAPAGKDVVFVYLVATREPGTTCATVTAQQTRLRFR